MELSKSWIVVAKKEQWGNFYANTDTYPGVKISFTAPASQYSRWLPIVGCSCQRGKSHVVWQ